MSTDDGRMLRHHMQTLDFIFDAILKPKKAPAMIQTFTFAVRLNGNLRVEAESAAAARKLLAATLESATVSVLGQNNAHELLGAVELKPDSYPMLESVDAAETTKPWAKEDADAAHAEGWNVFYSTDYGQQIERVDEADAFESDDHAIKFVRTRARLGNEVAKRALAIHDSNPGRAELKHP